MSPVSKGVVGIALGVFALFSIGVLDLLNIRLSAPIVVSGSLLCSFLAVYFGVQARKNNAKIIGLASLTLGVIGVVVLGRAALSLIAYYL